MTEGTSQGLFVVVAIVIFGIFIGLTYTLFGSEGLTNDLKLIFTNSIEKTTNNLKNNKQLVYSSDKEVNYANDGWGTNEPNEFMWYGTDLMPIANEHGLGEYIFEFEIKTAKEGKVQMYTQNGGDKGSRIGYIVMDTTTEYQKVTKKVTIGKSTQPETASRLSFYGTYYTGVYPTVKNMRIYKVLN